MSLNFIVGIPRCNEPLELLAETLRAITASRAQPARVVIIDNGDAPLERALVKPCEVIRPQQNLGCAGTWNLLHTLAKPTPLILLNADCAVTPDTFERMCMSANPIVCAYGFGCFMMTDAVWRSVGEFDEEYYPVYFEDSDYRYRCKLAGVTLEEWSATDHESIYPGRNRAATGIVHGKHDPEGYQGWRGEKLAWFHARWEANRQRYLAKWGGDVGQERFTTPFGVSGVP
jgi:GT2 family glycosyltransferase